MLSRIFQDIVPEETHYISWTFRLVIQRRCLPRSKSYQRDLVQPWILDHLTRACVYMSAELHTTTPLLTHPSEHAQTLEKFTHKQ